MGNWWVWEPDSGYPGIDLMCSADDRAKLIAEHGREAVAEKFAALTIEKAMELTQDVE